MTKATVAAVNRAEAPEPQGDPILSNPGAKKMIITCSISGVPRMIHTMVLVSQAIGLKLLIEPKAMISPRGNENKRVMKNSWTFSPKLSISLKTIACNPVIGSLTSYTVSYSMQGQNVLPLHQRLIDFYSAKFWLYFSARVSRVPFSLSVTKAWLTACAKSLPLRNATP